MISFVGLQLLLLTGALSQVHGSPNALYSSASGNTCLANASEYLQTVGLINDRQCAIACNTNSLCGVFMTVKSNATCLLYLPMNSTRLQSVTYQSNEGCRIGYIPVIVPPTPVPSGQIPIC
jgi:hypothetical protein